MPPLSDKNVHVVPMPSFTDPNDARAAAGSINFGSPNFPDLEDHPFPHSDDYGESVEPEYVEPPTEEERESWLKADWVKQAKEYGLDTRGATDLIKARIEEFEAEQAAAAGAQSTSNNDF